MVGFVASTSNVTDLVASTLPARSVEKNSTVCEPSPVTWKAPAYVCQAPPSTRYEVVSIPAPPPA